MLMEIPLAERMRPVTLSQFVGQDHLAGIGGPIRSMIENRKVTSMILWGPPGVGKTTLAHIIASSIDANFVFFSAVTSGVEDVRKVIKQARIDIENNKKQTVLFVDEIHRFNKSQQDGFLPYVEDGTIILIGATTENPGFRVNAPLISRSQVYKLSELADVDIKKVVVRAIKFYKKNK